MSKETRKKVPGMAYVHSSFNNTIITITNDSGDTLAWSSGGNAGFKGSRRATGYAAQQAAEKVGQNARELGVTSVDLFLKGIGKGRYTAAKGLRASGLEIHSITDTTPLAHNGCRPPKKRRI